MTLIKKYIGTQKIIYAGLAVAFFYALYTYQAQLITIADVLQSGTWWLVLGSILVLVLAIYNQASLYASLYQLFGLPAQKRRLLPLYLVTKFVSVAAPSGGLSGWVPFIQDAKQRDLKVGTVLVANLVYMILWYTTFAIFLEIGLTYLLILHDLQWFEVSAALLLYAADLLMISSVVLAWVAPERLESVLHRVAGIIGRIAGWFKRLAPLTNEQMTTFANDLNRAVMQMKKVGYRALMRPVGHALLNETLNLLIFYLLAAAFNIPLNFGVLVAAYSISILFYIVSPTPGGIGFVEGTLILVLTSLGVPPGKATGLTLAYRGITFWLPFMLGFIAIRWTSKHPTASN